MGAIFPKPLVFLEFQGKSFSCLKLQWNSLLQVSNINNSRSLVVRGLRSETKGFRFRVRLLEIV